MHTNARSSRFRSIARHLLLMPAAAVALSLTFAGIASAQTGFQASIKEAIPKPAPPTCPEEAFLCGTATTNYGPATWAFEFINATPVSKTCDSYQYAVTFQLADGSRLVLDENGTACFPGGSNSTSASPASYGHPIYLSGSWTVQSTSGQFGSVTGPGTDTQHAAGAHLSGTYQSG